MITLATLAEATEQQVFDQVALHLKKQNARSVKPGSNTCVYRSPTGLMCAAGCLIAESEYRIELDDSEHGTSWGELVSASVAPSTHKKLIGGLQSAHDMHHRIEDVLIAVKAVGKRYCLDTSVLD